MREARLNAHPYTTEISRRAQFGSFFIDAELHVHRSAAHQAAKNESHQDGDSHKRELDDSDEGDIVERPAKGKIAFSSTHVFCCCFF